MENEAGLPTAVGQIRKFFSFLKKKNIKITKNVSWVTFNHVFRIQICIDP